jgi:phosphonatase-like hydrolase
MRAHAPDSARIALVVFDLSGTTIADDNAVARCLHRAALEHDVDVPLVVFERTIGTNKIHLYEFLLARAAGREVGIEQLEALRFPEHHERAMELFARYSELMIDHYAQETRPMAGAEETFAWCKEHGLLVATDTGFHRDVNQAIHRAVRWVERGLVDLALDVEHTGGVGRPAPYMIFRAMRELGVQDVHSVAKIGDTPADLWSGHNGGCGLNIGVTSGANARDVLEACPHTHIVSSVADLPALIESAGRLPRR